MKAALPKALLLTLWILLPEFSTAQETTPDTLSFSDALEMNDVQRRNYRHTGDLLSFMPGLWVRDLGAPGQWSACRFWGGDEDQTVILLNGHPIQ